MVTSNENGKGFEAFEVDKKLISEAAVRFSAGCLKIIINIMIDWDFYFGEKCFS